MEIESRMATMASACEGCRSRTRAMSLAVKEPVVSEWRVRRRSEKVKAIGS